MLCNSCFTLYYISARMARSHIGKPLLKQCSYSYTFTICFFNYNNFLVIKRKIIFSFVVENNTKRSQIREILERKLFSIYGGNNRRLVSHITHIVSFLNGFIFYYTLSVNRILKQMIQI